MARGKPARGGRRGKATPAAPPQLPAADPPPATGLKLPSPDASTNLVIADIVLRAAGGLLRDRLERGLLVKAHDPATAERLVAGRGIATSLALWGASRVARRSPLGLAVVAGGLAAKVLYDRGKRIEARRRGERKPATPDTPSPADPERP
jgi:hypothetical protein